MRRVSMQQQIWNVLRILKACKIEDIIIGCSTAFNRDSMTRYLWLLERGGYVVKNNDVFKLVKNTGRKAPVQLGKGIIKDKNLEKLVSLEGVKPSKRSLMIDKIKRLKEFTLNDLEEFGTKLCVQNLNARFIKKGEVQAIGYKGKFKVYRYIGEQ